MSSNSMNKALRDFIVLMTFVNSITEIFGPGPMDPSCMAVSNSVVSAGLSLLLEVFLACFDRSRDRIRQ